VSLDPERNRVQIPPVGRYLHVAVCDDAYSLLLDLAPHLTTVGMFNPEHLPGRLQAAIGDRRYVALGEMQKPRFDGPVDLRRGFTPEQL
jgi:hypothetical protein